MRHPLSSILLGGFALLLLAVSASTQTIVCFDQAAKSFHESCVTGNGRATD